MIDLKKDFFDQIEAAAEDLKTVKMELKEARRLRDSVLSQRVNAVVRRCRELTTI